MLLYDSSLSMISNTGLNWEVFQIRDVLIIDKDSK